MKKKLFKAIGLSALALFVGSCGISDENSPEACKFEVSQALDKGNYDVVIQKLQSDPTCGGAYTKKEGNIQLAAAYIGKAGFDIPTLVNDIITSGNNIQNGNSFQVFTQAIANKINGNSLNYLTKAQSKYDEIIGNNNICDNPPDDITKDACFYKNLVNVATATASLSLALSDLTGGKDIVQDVKTWVNPTSCDDLNDNGVGDNADMTASAIEYTSNGNCTIDSVSCIVQNNNLTFAKNNQSYIYTLLEITVDDKNGDDTSCSSNPLIAYKLIDTNTNSVALTNGFCKTDFTSCDSLDINNGCYPCPIVADDNTTVTVENTLVDVINNTDPNQIAKLAGGNNDADVVQTVEDFKQEVCGTDSYCTPDEISNYLTTLNQ